MKRLHKLNISYKEFGIRKQTKAEDLFLFLFFFSAYIPQRCNQFLNILFSNYQYYRKDLLGLLVFIWVTFTYLIILIRKLDQAKR